MLEILTSFDLTVYTKAATMNFQEEAICGHIIFPLQWNCSATQKISVQSYKKFPKSLSKVIL